MSMLVELCWLVGKTGTKQEREAGRKKQGTEGTESRKGLLLTKVRVRRKERLSRH